MSIKLYDLYKNGEIFKSDKTKEEIMKISGMTMQTVNMYLYHHKQSGIYRVIKAGEELKIEESCERKEENTKGGQSLENFISMLEDGLKGNKCRLQSLTKNNCIIKTAYNMAEISEKIGYDKGRQDVLNNTEVWLENARLKEEVAALKVQIKERNWWK